MRSTESSAHLDTEEHRRLADSAARRADWKKWGPYVSDRAWGTIREDYSPGGDAWAYFPHDHARSRAFRWNEDGLAGFCNRYQNLCLGLALWNGRDPILKERLFGLSNDEGNHGEDVKEYYYYLDAVPSHSYMKFLYKYPQVEFPYARLVEKNRRRSRAEPEYELVDEIGESLEEGRYFDVFVEYAKIDQEDIFCRITAINRGPEPAELHILPHAWFRNTWSWDEDRSRPGLSAEGDCRIRVVHKHLGNRWWHLDTQPSVPTLLFTENDTNLNRLYGAPESSPYVKDSIHEYVVNGRRDRVNPGREGTKAAAHYRATLGPGESLVIRTRLADRTLKSPFDIADAILESRIAEADAFHRALGPPHLTDDEALVQRQAYAGLLWSKQFYHYSVELWLDGDPAEPTPPESRKSGRNAGWRHATHLDVLSVPDKWEYPWFAAWDLAFHCVALARLDPEWARRQLVLLMREWYMNPNGQLPAYEWDFGDVNPPVHAHAARRVYEIAAEIEGKHDTDFLEEVFHKLLLNFTWWVNRKDPDGRNAFEGGFLGLDNIGVFDRSRPGFTNNSRLEQVDGTAWMGLFCLDMLAIALELTKTRPTYEAIATKFFEHFVSIAHAINGICGQVGMWLEEDGFYYDVIRQPGSDPEHLRIRSLVGLVPLFAVMRIEPGTLDRLPQFRRRMEWYLRYRPNLVGNVCLMTNPGADGSLLLSIADRAKLERVLPRVFDPTQFLSDYGLRSMSRDLAKEPYEYQGQLVVYEPAESSTSMYGGNSNWRGPIWVPVNHLLIEALRKYDRYYGDSFRVEMPRWAGRTMSLSEVADELTRRLSRIFLRDEKNGGRRPVFGGTKLFQSDPHWQDYLLFYEYFHGDDGAGLGASHQTGWTALIPELIRNARRD